MLIFIRIPEGAYLEFSRINFQEVRFNEIHSEEVSKDSHAICHLIEALCCNFHTELLVLTFEIRLLDPTLILELKVNICISDKFERYDGQKKHQGRLRLSSAISLITPSWKAD